MDVIVQVSPELAAALRRSPVVGGPAAEVIAAAGALGASLRPVHPETRAPELARHFVLDAPTLAAGREVAARLRALPGVEGAYVKPPDAQP